jgi:anti-sigma B factor antagonist
VTSLARLQVERRGDTAVARVAGDIDLSNAADVRTALEDAADPDVSGLVVDLSETGYVDSSGVSLLVGLANDYAVRRRRVVVAARPGSAVRRVLDIVQIGQVAPVYDSADDALAGLADG